MEFLSLLINTSFKIFRAYLGDKDERKTNEKRN